MFRAPLVNGNLHHITLTALIREIDLIALLSARLLLRSKKNKRLVKSGAQSNQHGMESPITDTDHLCESCAC